MIGALKILFHPRPIDARCTRGAVMVYSSFALYLLSGPASVAEEVVTVLGTVLLVSYLAGEVGSGDVCISMGCGDVGTLPEEVLARRAARRVP